jgi:D-serine dehydratase
MPEPHFVDDEESADYFITEAVKLKVAISKYERIPIEKSDFLIVKR